jgi:putative transposase
MAIRNLIFANEEIYHVYNRGVEKRIIFKSPTDYTRAIYTMWYYRYLKPELRFSYFNNLSRLEKQLYLNKLQNLSLKVEILCYCLMPNHFHMLLRQKSDTGIKSFMSAFSNSFARFFNTKYHRVGPLFQSEFKALRIEDDEQLIHLSRYIHINPATSFLVEQNNIESYRWSSLQEYLHGNEKSFCNKTDVLDHFKSTKEYKSFLLNQVNYARELHKINELVHEYT